MTEIASTQHLSNQLSATQELPAHLLHGNALENAPQATLGEIGLNPVVSSIWKRALGNAIKKAYNYNPFTISILDGGEKRVLDIVAVAQNLGVSKKSLINLQKSVRQDQQLRNQRNAASLQTDAIQQYRKLLGQASKGNLQVNKDLLLKIITQAVIHIRQSPNATDPMEGQVAFHHDDALHEYYYYKEAEGNLVIMKKTDFVGKKYLGEGSFARIYSVALISEVESKALKIARSDVEEPHEAKKDIQREYAITKKINGSARKTEGIMATPYAMFTILDKSPKNSSVGYLRDEFTCSIQELPPPSDLDICDSIKRLVQVITGLEHMHRLGIIHGDIKPENIVYNQSDGSWSLIDFGGSVDLEELSVKGTHFSAEERVAFMRKSLGDLYGTRTPAFCREDDFSALAVAHQDGKIALFVETLQSMDYFALAKTYIEVLLGERTAKKIFFSLEKDGFIVGIGTEIQLAKMLEKKGYPKELASILYQMLSEGSTLEPSVVRENLLSLDSELRLKELGKAQLEAMQPASIQEAKDGLESNEVAIVIGKVPYSHGLAYKVGEGPENFKTLFFNLHTEGQFLVEDGRLFKDVEAIISSLGNYTTRAHALDNCLNGEKNSFYSYHTVGNKFGGFIQKTAASEIKEITYFTKQDGKFRHGGRNHETMEDMIAYIRLGL